MGKPSIFVADMREKVSMWEQKATSDKLGAKFKIEPFPEKSEIVKQNEKTIGAYRKKNAAKGFQERAKSRGMSMYSRPAQLKVVFGAKLEKDVASFKPPVFKKSEEDSERIKKLISDNIFFNDLSDDEKKAFVDAFEPVKVEKGQTVIKQGDRGDYFYVLDQGKVAYSVDGEDTGSVENGACFGDLALIYSARRAASVQVESDSTKLFRVDQKTFRSLITKQLRIIDAEKEKLLRSVDFLKDVPPMHMKRLAKCLSTESFKAGQVVVKKGTAGNTFSIISEGELEVTDISVGSIKFDNSKLTKGDSFGERVLASSETRVANITATKPSVLFSIDKETFEKTVGNLSRMIMKSQDKKILEAVDLLKGAGLSAGQFEELADLIVDKEFKADETVLHNEKETEAAIYILREGSIGISGNDLDVIKPGGYFGEALLLLDSRLPSKLQNKTTPRITARTTEASQCGVLYLSECRQVFDTTTIPDLHDENKYYPLEVEEPDSDDELMLAAMPECSLCRETTKQWLRKASTDLLRQAVQKNIDLDDFEKHSVLGEGQFGEVWLVSAEIPEIHGRQYFALKIQHREDLSRGDSSDVIQREIDVLKLMDHPFIINFVSQYEDPKKMYILMRLVYGGELFDVIHYENDDGTWSSGIPEKDSKFYCMMIADTLEYMHRKKFVFRDLKPENVLIDKDGYPVICDFGFTKYVEDLTYTMCGTPNYLSPEVILNKGHNFATDHWSLGVLLYEMVAGENPFFYDDMPQMELFENIVQEKYYPLPDDVSDEAFEVIDGLLIKDPTQRLGALAGRGKDIINMPWFEELDLVQLRQKVCAAPFKPQNTELDRLMKIHQKDEPSRHSAPAKHNHSSIGGLSAPFSSFGKSSSGGGGLCDSSDDDD